MLNEQAPFRLFNALSDKEKNKYQNLWPRMKEKLQKKFNTEFILDSNYNLFYDNSKATKQEVLDTIKDLFKYRNKEDKLYEAFS